MICYTQRELDLDITAQESHTDHSNSMQVKSFLDNYLYCCFQSDCVGLRNLSL